MSHKVEQTRMLQLTSWLMRWRWVMLGVAVLWLIPAIFFSKKLTLERSIESLYGLNSPQLLKFQKSKKIFGGDEIVIVAFEDPQLTLKKRDDYDDEENEIADEEVIIEVDEEEEFPEYYEELSPVSRQRIQEFSHQLQQVPGVRSESIQDLCTATSPKTISFQIIGERTFALADEEIFSLVEGMLIGKDHRTTAIAMRLIPEAESTISKAETIRKIRKTAQEFQSKHHLKTYVVGEPVQVHDMFRYVEQDGRGLFFLSLGLLATVIFVFFRNVRWVVLPLFVVLLAVFTTEGLLAIIKVRLSMVSSLLNSLVTIISIATVTHITVRYREHLRTEIPTVAFSRTFTELLPAIFWTCSTTAIGFLALISSDITPVRSFGVMMAIATLLVLCATIVSLPGGALLGGKQYELGVAPAENQLSNLLDFLNRFIQRNPRFVGWGFLLVMLFSCGGFYFLEVETDFSKNFRSSSPIVQSLNFVESRLGGAGTWEVNFPAPKKLTKQYLTKVRQLAHRLRTEVNQPDQIKLTKVLCMADGIDAIPRMPVVSNNLQKKIRILNIVQPEFSSELYNAKAGRMRIMLRSKERQPAGIKLKLIDQVQSITQDWANKELKEDFPNAEVEATGVYVLLAYLIDNLLNDQLVSFALAAIGIVLMMFIAFRDFKIGLISLVPNLFPILLVIGGMGWAGVSVNIATAMIASVSLGLTIDSSIHYLSEFQRARQVLSMNDALQQTHQRVGRAMVFSNIALIVGFSVLTFSHFIPLVYFGILVSLAMLGGLAGNLILLPLLLRWAVGEEVSEEKEETSPPIIRLSAS